MAVLQGIKLTFETNSCHKNIKMFVISCFPSVDPLTGEVIGQRDPDVTLRQLSAPAPVKSNNTIQLDLD